MFQDKYVFVQLTAFLNRTQFNNYVRKYDGNRYVKHFTCWNQLLAMMFGQLSYRESLRDLIVALEAHRATQYHLGLGRNTIVKATLAYANQTQKVSQHENWIVLGLGAIFFLAIAVGLLNSELVAEGALVPKLFLLGFVGVAIYMGYRALLIREAISLLQN